MTMVLDYLRRTASPGQLVVPPFHTGHLAFIPETDVQLVLLRDRPAPEHGAEICITPFDVEPHTLFTIKGVMIDKPGVVERLIKAVASLKINIVTLESSSIDDLSRHEVFMLLDWSTTDTQDRQPIPADVRNRFTDLHSVLQTNDRRYLTLLERIISLCGDILDWLPTDPSVPNIQMHPLDERRDVVRRGHAVVKRDPERRFHVLITIPDDILRRIEDATAWLPPEPLPYLIMSDTDSRTLRVFFPKKGKDQSLMHVAFAHIDRPGALSAITEVVAASNFSIINSLVRHEHFRQSVWETLLEYRGPEAVPAEPEHAMSWFANKLRFDDNTRGLMKYFDVSLAIPRYPRLRTEIPTIPLYNATDNSVTTLETSIDGTQALEEMKSIIDSHEVYRPRRWLFESLAGIRRTKPSIFLSYPKSAVLHADVLKGYLRKEGYDTVEYQSADLNVLRAEVKHRITHADFFLGIWHPEPDRPGEVSPWLPFEFGIASTLNKPAAIIASTRVHQHVWMRIEKNVAIPQYEDVTFERETVPLLLAYCKRNWTFD